MPKLLTKPDWSALIPILPGKGPRANQLYQAIRRLIETGLVPPGAKLPTTRDLARRLGISRSAAIAAFELLTAEGFTEARVGAGTFVATHVPQRAPSPPARPAPPSALAAEPVPPLPGTLGIAMADERTWHIFRKLMSRRLSRPAPEHFAYGDPRGSSALREAVAAYLRTARGVRCDAQSIVITSGTQQGLDLIARVLICPGDPVLVEDPCYPMARSALVSRGARLIGIPVDREGLNTLDEKQPLPRARAVYVTPSHQYPLGVTMTMRRRLALLDWARHNDAWIIEDDYDSEFRYLGPPLAAMQGIDDAARVIYLGTFSKVLFPGLRLGYAVIPDALLDAVLALRVSSDRQPSTLAEAALADLIAQGHFAAHLRRARRRAQASRDVLVATLRDHGPPVLTVEPPAQGLHLVAKLASPRLDVEIGAAAKAAGIGARPLSPMYVTMPPQQGLVLGFSGFPDEDLRKAARRLCEIVRTD
ncbi:PLP-dependent aminotransferase family protein [Rhodoligotrophos defluvii]|uniref:MocR-like pyridoxine biosynthesis transcription factor PdxR n=1 Tax=Rhodoligotrophos defluvii TaxID=2561934 RepID=UPI0010C98786|nr:PLP-dependent aminotransferase family protein [Rhodoligotrophos defluvii]